MANTKFEGTSTFTGTVVQGSRLVKAFAETTTDATATVVYAHPLAELAGVKLKASAICVRSTGAEGSRLETDSGFIRAAAGNVTILGTNTSTSGKVSTGTPTLTIVANTGNQTCDVVVTGEAAKTFNWRIVVEIE